jgi:hypothetical protein
MMDTKTAPEVSSVEDAVSELDKYEGIDRTQATDGPWEGPDATVPDVEAEELNDELEGEEEPIC